MCIVLGVMAMYGNEPGSNEMEAFKYSSCQYSICKAGSGQGWAELLSFAFLCLMRLVMTRSALGLELRGAAAAGARRC